MIEKKILDAIIIGGSYAGLSAALSLGRSLRNVVVIDSGAPCNASTPHSHNFLTQDGERPNIIAEKAKAQVLNYPTIKFINALAVGGEKTGDVFEVTTDTGEAFAAKKLIFATGIKDTMPQIKGFAECWGISVIHCPYCHGYEFRGNKTGVMARGERAFHLAMLVNNLTDDVTLFTSGSPELSPEQLSVLWQNKTRIIESEITEIEHIDGQIRRVAMRNGRIEDLKALYAALPFEQHSDLPSSFGCGFTDAGHILIDGFQKTTVDGIFACGDNSAMMRSVSNAVYAGNLAGVMVNKELAEASFIKARN